MKSPAAARPALQGGLSGRAPGSPSRSGQLPEGDVRLTANIRADLHLALKIRAARERTTIGELIEEWVESWKDQD